MMITEKFDRNEAIPTVTDPIALVREWIEAAWRSEPKEADAACLATATADGIPSARMVLLKGVDSRGFVFYSNRNSRKGDELSANPRAALCLHWKSLGRQIRIEGRVEPVSDIEADAYFASRPRGSQIGAWASEQSRPLADRQALADRFEAAAQRFEGAEVPRPPFWVGFRIVPRRIEFWLGSAARLHDRLVYEPDGNGWSAHRLFP